MAVLESERCRAMTEREAQVLIADEYREDDVNAMGRCE